MPRRKYRVAMDLWEEEMHSVFQLLHKDASNLVIKEITDAPVVTFPDTPKTNGKAPEAPQAAEGKRIMHNGETVTHPSEKEGVKYGGFRWSIVMWDKLEQLFREHGVLRFDDDRVAKIIEECGYKKSSRSPLFSDLVKSGRLVRTHRGFYRLPIQGSAEDNRAAIQAHPGK